MIHSLYISLRRSGHRVIKINNEVREVCIFLCRHLVDGFAVTFIRSLGYFDIILNLSVSQTLFDIAGV